MSWLKAAMLATAKPKESVIAILKKNLGGPQEGRSREIVHASDITKVEFCPRKWAFMDLKAIKSESEYLPVAMDVTFQMGLAAETLLVEEWLGASSVGNWLCRRCGDQRTMVNKPSGFCKDGKSHWWQYIQTVVESEDYAVSGSIDCLVDVGSSKLMLTEIKTMNPTDFEKIIVPLPEHRLRTNLYLALVSLSNNPYKERFNLLEARVLYISRGYGKMNEVWNEILPFKEFEVKRDDADLKPALQKAKALKLFREGKGMPSGICATAMDKIAKTCSCCTYCFSGQFPATIQCGEL